MSEFKVLCMWVDACHEKNAPGKTDWKPGNCKACPSVKSCKTLWDEIQDSFDMNPSEDNIKDTSGKGYDPSANYGTEALAQILNGMPPGGY
jgi:hypothetical protein